MWCSNYYLQNCWQKIILNNFCVRSQSDWEEAWHKEKYTRCRETLIKHLYWACEKDIYRLTRRSDQSGFNNYLTNIEEGKKKIMASV